MNLVGVQRGDETFESYSGLARTSPFLAFAMLVAMASLAGVPLTAGFVGKFLIFVLALQQKQYCLVAVAVMGAAVGCYYYLRVVKSMYWDPPAEEGGPTSDPVTVPWPTGIGIILLVVGIIYFGVYPKALLMAVSLRRNDPIDLIFHP